MSLRKRLIIAGGLLSLDTYSVTPASISGTGTTTLTHTVTGGPGAEFTLSIGGGTRTIPSNGTFTTTSSQGPNGHDAAARTLTYTATNSNDPLNVLTDTVSQGSGPSSVNASGTVTISTLTADGTNILDGTVSQAGGPYDVAMTGTYTVTTAATGNADTTARLQARQSGGLDAFNFSPTINVGSLVTNSPFSVTNNNQNFPAQAGYYIIADISPGGFFWDGSVNPGVRFTVVA